ncbi:FUN14 domain-containing protein [Methylomicrobium sp. Wu6]|uniref:FUN14 domain-containing protein n=1 Tax=Methylomicrobium sp. Wu6 TaxID=3107928 RepID=UPI002DD61E0A|nr:FUN14 domain-containing protein [Methylomicrobium sp. Wu6]MEC4747590.1 FUN14 domain-containing protein [Methylomicrobium sp. Wu6]
MTQQAINIPSSSGNDIFSAPFLLGNVGAPFVIGMAVGYFAKIMLKTALFIGGGLVVLMFVGEYYGIININGAELEHVADAATQVAKDSGNYLAGRLSTITTRGVSAVAGFTLGFKLG